MTRRWHHAAGVSTALRAALEPVLDAQGPGRDKQVAGELFHYYLDTFLHEAECRLRLGEFESAELQSGLAATMYQRSPYRNHLQEALLFLSESQAELNSPCVHLGDGGGPESVLQHLIEELTSSGANPTVMASALCCRANLSLKRHAYSAAEADLREALHLRHSESANRERPHGNMGEDAWRLGQVLLSQGRIDEARDLLQQVCSPYLPAPAALYVARLQSAVFLSLGRIDAAIDHLQAQVEAFAPGPFPDEQVDLCLDCHRMLTAVGSLAHAARVLDTAEGIATRSGHLWRVGNIRLARILTLVDSGDVTAGRIVRDQLLTGEYNVADVAARARAYGLLLGPDPTAADSPADALSLIRTVRSTVERVELSLRISELLLEMGRVVPSWEFADHIASDAGGGLEPAQRLRLHTLRGRILSCQGKHRAATEEYSNGIRLFETIHSAGLLGGQQSALWKMNQTVYDLQIISLLTLGETRRSLYYLERSRARFTLTQLHWASSLDATDNRVNRYLDILKQLSLMDLAAIPTPEHLTQRASLQRELDKIRTGVPDHVIDLAVFPEPNSIDTMIYGILTV